MDFPSRVLAQQPQAMLAASSVAATDHLSFTIARHLWRTNDKREFPRQHWWQPRKRHRNQWKWRKPIRNCGQRVDLSPSTRQLELSTPSHYIIFVFRLDWESRGFAFVKPGNSCIGSLEVDSIQRYVLYKSWCWNERKCWINILKCSSWCHWELVI